MLGICPKCTGRYMTPSRYEYEEAICIRCGYVQHTPTPPSARTGLIIIDDPKMNNAPFGFERVVGDGVIDNPTEQAALALMLQLGDEGWTWTEIARAVSERGYYTRAGNPWRPSGVRALILKYRARRERAAEAMAYAAD